MGRLFAATVMSGALALPSSLASTPGGRLRRQSYVEYSWAELGEHCPQGFLPVWDRQRCDDAQEAVTGAGIETQTYDRKTGYVTPEDFKADKGLHLGCTMKYGGEVPKFEWRSPNPSLFNNWEIWNGVDLEREPKVNRVCYRPTIIVKFNELCPASHEAVTESDKCAKIAQMFEGNGDEVNADGPGEVCKVNYQGQFRMRSQADEDHVVCSMKNVYIGHMQEKCQNDADKATVEECHSFRQLTDDESWFEQIANVTDQKCQDATNKGGGAGCTCLVMPPGHWRLWWDKRGDTFPVCTRRIGA